MIKGGLSSTRNYVRSKKSRSTLNDELKAAEAELAELTKFRDEILPERWKHINQATPGAPIIVWKRTKTTGDALTFDEFDADMQILIDESNKIDKLREFEKKKLRRVLKDAQTKVRSFELQNLELLEADKKNTYTIELMLGDLVETVRYELKRKGVSEVTPRKFIYVFTQIRRFLTESIKEVNNEISNCKEALRMNKEEN